ncbi:MAG: hypothetical protein PF486_09785 [Prolixibacteraceae bacterium]|jgi:hypothetical protein|nr:hypothetical protein [Prolixibacteraceae bacterium]
MIKEKKIVDPNPVLSVDNILFIDPVITLENTHKSVSINGKDYYYVPRRLHVASELLRNGNLLYHFRRERNVFGNRHKMKQINEDVDNIVKCNYSLNTCIGLLGSFKSNFNSKMAITTIDAALESCFKVKDSFSYYNNKLGGENTINVLRNLITKLPSGNDNKNLHDKLKELSEVKTAETVIL